MLKKYIYKVIYVLCRRDETLKSNKITLKYNNIICVIFLILNIIHNIYIIISVIFIIYYVPELPIIDL